MRPIGQAAIELLNSLPQKRGLALFFPSDLVDRPYCGVPETLRTLCSIANIKDVTRHILRHTFASVAGEVGFSELTIKALLGHGARGATQNYVHIDEALRLAVERVSSKIAGLLDTRAHRQHPTRESRGTLLCHDQHIGYRRVT